MHNLSSIGSRVAAGVSAFAISFFLFVASLPTSDAMVIGQGILA